MTEIKRQTAAMADALNVVGLMNVQFAIQNVDGKDVIYVLEVNPRASRTVPFVSKATGIQLAKVAARCMAGQSLASQGITQRSDAAVFQRQGSGVPVRQVPGRGHHPRPRDEIHRRGDGRGQDLWRSLRQVPAGCRHQVASRSPAGEPAGKVFLTVKKSDKPRAVEVARQLGGLGFELVATKGTAAAIAAAGRAVRLWSTR